MLNLNGIVLATAAQPKGSILGGLLIPMILMLGFFYIIVYIPENKRKKKYKGMLESLQVNDEIITKGGILGKIINIQDTFIILESGPSRARIKLDKNGILSVLSTVETQKEEIKDSSKEVKKEEVKEKVKEEVKEEVKFKEN